MLACLLRSTTRQRKAPPLHPLSLGNPAGDARIQGAIGQRTACSTADNRLPFEIMIKEHDCIVLTRDLMAEGLKAGDIGTVVHVHPNGAGYEVEFMTLAGETVGVVTLMPEQLRSIARRDIAHVRELQTA